MMTTTVLKEEKHTAKAISFNVELNKTHDKPLTEKDMKAKQRLEAVSAAPHPTITLSTIQEKLKRADERRMATLNNLMYPKLEVKVMKTQERKASRDSAEKEKIKQTLTRELSRAEEKRTITLGEKIKKVTDHNKRVEQVKNFINHKTKKETETEKQKLQEKMTKALTKREKNLEVKVTAA